MTTRREYIIVRCSHCEIIIERVTAETMVYCIACCKWCREVEAVKIAAAANMPSTPRPRRRMRCH